MEWPRWQPTYEAILQDFGYSRGADAAARDELKALLAERRLAREEALRELFEDRVALVVGAGPQLAAWRPPGGLDAAVVACDAATAPLLAKGLQPDLVATDLDGAVDAQVEANRRGATVVVHAHGDNRAALRAWVPRFPGAIMGTTQAEPSPPVANYGGFTDGDRAGLLADHFGAREVRLVAFDFTRPGPYPTADAAAKARKLRWARRILRECRAPVTGASLR